LAITKELVEGMGGRIACESVAGQGSCFYFELPLQDGTGDATMPAAAPSSLPRVLHVEADDELHAAVRDLSATEIALVQARSVAQARELLAQASFAAVVLDLALPDGDGWTLLPQIRAAQPEACVLVLSGRALDVAEQDQVDAALLKSQASPRALLDALARVCERATANKQGGATNG
jgi:DNA-binding NtrC family response regulator